MESARRARLAFAVRERLFRVATKAFVSVGYERASLNAILAESGVGKSTFFYYFLDKGDLFASVIEAAVARMAEAVGPLDLPESPRTFWRDARAVIERWGKAAASEPDLLGLLRAMHPLRHTSPRLSMVMNEVRAAYRALLLRGVELGAVRRDISVDTLIALTEAIDLALDDEFHRNPNPDDAALAAHRARFFDVVQRILRK